MATILSLPYGSVARLKSRIISSESDRAPRRILSFHHGIQLLCCVKFEGVTRFPWQWNKSPYGICRRAVHHRAPSRDSDMDHMVVAHHGLVGDVTGYAAFSLSGCEQGSVLCGKA